MTRQADTPDSPADSSLDPRRPSSDDTNSRSLSDATPNDNDPTSASDGSMPNDEARLLGLLGPGNYRRIADAASLTRPHVSRILRGIVDPSPDALQRIATTVGLPTSSVTYFIDHYKERRDLSDVTPTPRANGRPQIDGAVLRQARIGKGYTQDDVATLAGIDHTYVSQIESGRTPSDRVLKKIAKVLDLTMGDVVTSDDAMPNV